MALPRPGYCRSKESAQDPLAPLRGMLRSCWTARNLPIAESSERFASCSRKGARNRPPVRAIQRKAAVKRIRGRYSTLAAAAVIVLVLDDAVAPHACSSQGNLISQACLNLFSLFEPAIAKLN